MNTQKNHEALLKKVEGHFDELKGALLKVTGHKAKGEIEILKGKAMNKKADLDIATQDLHKHIQHDIEKAKQKVRSEFKHTFA